MINKTIISNLINERWHIIDGYENYFVTESGKVYAYRDEESKTGW